MGHNNPSNRVYFAIIYTFLHPKRCGNVTFLSPNKKVTKEVGIGEALRKSALPYVPHPPQRRPVFKNVPIFEHLHPQNSQDCNWQTAENRDIFGCRMAMRRVDS